MCLFNVSGAAQLIVSVPSTAQPAYIIRFVTPGVDLLDTVYQDQQQETYAGKSWYGIYKTTWVPQRSEPSGFSPLKIGLTREEGRKVYFVDLNNVPEPRIGLLYDYSLGLNDSTYILSQIRNLGIEPDTNLVVVEQVDYINCSFGRNIKRMLVQAYYDYPNDTISTVHLTHWYEGIGDIYHPYLPTTCSDLGASLCEEFPAAYSVRLNDQWYDSQDWNCQLTTSSQLPSSPGKKIGYYPNPVDASRTVTLSAPEGNAVLQVDVYNANGRHLLRQTDPVMGLGLLDLRSIFMPPGLYYGVARLRSGGEEVLQLVVK